MKYMVASLDGERSHLVEAEHYYLDHTGALVFYGPPDDARPSYPPPIVRVFSSRYWSQFHLVSDE